MRRRARLELGALHGAGVIRSLLPVAAFQLGNVATSLLILRATTLLHHGGPSIAAATSVVGLLWTPVSPTVGFAYAAGWMLVSLLGAGAIGRCVRRDGLAG